MSDELVLSPKEVDIALWSDIAYNLTTGQQELDNSDEPTHVWIANKWGLEPQDVIAILAHPQFASFLHHVQVSIARTDFDIHAFVRLNNIIRHGSDKDSIAASKELADLIDYRKSHGPQVAVNINLDGIVNQMATGEIIDVEPDFPGL
jgi:hypothetical protein